MFVREIVASTVLVRKVSVKAQCFDPLRRARILTNDRFDCWLFWVVKDAKNQPTDRFSLVNNSSLQLKKVVEP